MAKTPKKKGVDVVEKRPVGRPSKYKPEYCDEVIEMAKLGKGWASYAAKFEIDRTTLYDWAEQHEEFSTALKRAKIYEQEWWENVAQSGLFADKFNAVAWKTSVQARFRDDYTEKKVTEISGVDGRPIEIQSRVVDVASLDQERREKLRELLTAIKEGEKK